MWSRCVSPLLQCPSPRATSLLSRTSTRFPNPCGVAACSELAGARANATRIFSTPSTGGTHAVDPFMTMQRPSVSLIPGGHAPESSPLTGSRRIWSRIRQQCGRRVTPRSHRHPLFAATHRELSRCSAVGVPHVVKLEAWAFFSPLEQLPKHKLWDVQHRAIVQVACECCDTWSVERAYACCLPDHTGFPDPTCTPHLVPAGRTG